jgi:hypothetical protein
MIPNYPLFQLHIYIFVSFLVFTYTFVVKPLSEKSMNYQNILNEAILLIASYHLLLFSDYIDDTTKFFNFTIDFKSVFGWSMLCMIFLGVLFNVAIIIKVLIDQVKRKLMIRKYVQMQK